jgi:hypothetical protein
MRSSRAVVTARASRSGRGRSAAESRVGRRIADRDGASEPVTPPRLREHVLAKRRREDDDRALRIERALPEKRGPVAVSADRQEDRFARRSRPADRLDLAAIPGREDTRAGVAERDVDVGEERGGSGDDGSQKDDDGEGGERAFARGAARRISPGVSRPEEKYRHSSRW